MKKVIFMSLVLVIFGLCVVYNENIINFTVKNIIKSKHEATLLANNEYVKINNYDFVHENQIEWYKEKVTEI